MRVPLAAPGGEEARQQFGRLKLKRRFGGLVSGRESIRRNIFNLLKLLHKIMCTAMRRVRRTDSDANPKKKKLGIFPSVPFFIALATLA
ncbi:MAG: hypothetical protein HOM58_07490 [Rhodospirillaceae bacterium]|jgi:hypothetical protein|nr:hypothetical protein [Rhodospirillaceae bacterium]